MTGTLHAELARLSPGHRVFLPGTTGEMSALADLLQAEPDRAAGVHFIGCFVPGMNEFDYAGLHPQARATTFLLPRAMHASFREGRVEAMAQSYFDAARLLAAMEYDVAFAHVSPPDADGCCSLGIAADFAPLAWPRARRKVMVINPEMPAMPRGPRLRLADADVVVEAEMPLLTAPPAGPASGEIESIARSVAGLVPDGAVIQTGIGGVPGAVWAHLTSHRDLVIRSGLAVEPMRALADAGALAAGGHTVGIAYGSHGFYDYLAQSDLCAFATTLETHDVAALGALDRFHAINSALEVDLFGQVNVEWQSGRLSSGVGGAANFVRAATASHEGRAIVALPATAKHGTISRIVPRLASPTVGLARVDADTFVTEHGIAKVRDLGIDARAQALIALAAPEFRVGLEADWAAMRATF